MLRVARLSGRYKTSPDLPETLVKVKDNPIDTGDLPMLDANQ